MPPTWHTQSPGQSWPWRWMPTITTGGWPCSREPLGQSGSLSHSSAGSLASDVAAWCKECTACNKAKVTVQPAMMVENMDIPAARFSHVHVDILRPLPLSHEGYTHLLTMIDRSTHWPVAVLLRVTTLTLWARGWLTLACPQSLLRTAGCSSPQLRGETGVPGKGSSTSPPLPSTLRQIIWWSTSIGR